MFLNNFSSLRSHILVNFSVTYWAHVSSTSIHYISAELVVWLAMKTIWVLCYQYWLVLLFVYFYVRTCLISRNNIISNGMYFATFLLISRLHFWISETKLFIYTFNARHFCLVYARQVNVQMDFCHITQVCCIRHSRPSAII